MRYHNTDADNHIYWGNELKLPKDVISEDLIWLMIDYSS